ncbi:MAG: twin-arginine translocase subunit TatC, partial [Tissierellaceae bacterium]
LLAFGTIFELPIVMFLLTKFGIVRSSFYTKYRKYMILIIFIVAAILTPPDVVSQVLMALPMLLLYEIGIVFSKFGQKKKENI